MGSDCYPLLCWQHRSRCHRRSVMPTAMLAAASAPEKLQPPDRRPSCSSDGQHCWPSQCLVAILTLTACALAVTICSVACAACFAGLAGRISIETNLAVCACSLSSSTGTFARSARCARWAAISRVEANVTHCKATAQPPAQGETQHVMYYRARLEMVCRG